jgi:hypothetical protein
MPPTSRRIATCGCCRPSPKATASPSAAWPTSSASRSAWPISIASGWYLLTPKGISEKTRLTYEFMEYSLYLYSQVRFHLRAVLEPYGLCHRKRVAVYGTGEAAELAFLSIAELGLELVAVFNDGGVGRFLGHTVRHINGHDQVAFDLLLVATLEPSQQIVERLVQLGIDRSRLATLRPTTTLGNGDRRGKHDA